MKQFTLLLLAAVSACTTKTETSSSSWALGNTPEGKAVEERLTQYYQDMSDRDWEKYRSHFWDNATITTVWQAPGDTTARVDVTTVDDFIREAPNGPDSQPVFEERMTGSEIQTHGNIAEAWVDYEAKFGKPDSLREWKGMDVFTLLRHNGQWKIVSLVFEGEN